MDKRSRRRKAPMPKRQMPVEEELHHVIPYEVIKEDGSGTDKIKCSYCCKTFEAVEGHEQHRCRKVKDFLLSCLSCNKRYVDHFFNEQTERIYPETENQIENHAEAASRRAVVPKYSYQCCVCQKTYSDISITVRHIKYHVQRKAAVAEPTLHCGQCGKSFTTKQQLSKHETVHTDVRPFKCKDCDKWFKTLDNVKRHMFVHNDERPFACPTCSKEFKAKHTLKKHEQTHDDERVFECPECDKKYKAKNSLRDHLRVHSGQRPYKCQQCDQAFYRPSHLATHKLVHSKLKPFSCKDCDKSFGRREHLKVHERIHSGEKPFKCNLCDRAFNQQAGLQAHIVSHSEVRPHTCVKCKKTFKYQSQVKHHACKPDGIELRVNEDQRRTLGIGGDKVPLLYGHCGDEASSSEISSPTPCLNPTSTIILIQIQSPPQTAMLSEGIEDAHRVIAPGDGSTRDEDSDNMLQGSSVSSNDVVVPEQITVENSTTVSGEEVGEVIAGLENMIAREILEKIG